MARQATANSIINRAALEMGIAQVSDPVASNEEAFIQLTGLLTSAGQELVELHDWQVLRQSHTITVVNPGDTGTYDLPDNFSHMIDQTGWDTTNNNPLGGPMSAQSWTRTVGSGITESTVYASFRLAENKIDLFPQPPGDGTVITFEYISRDWVQEAGESAPNTDEINAGSATVLYEPILIVKFLKCKFLEAKGMDSNAARLEFENMFNSRAGKDEGAPTLNAAGGTRELQYINPINNLSDTGYGL